jgi:hypothetical protein
MKNRLFSFRAIFLIFLSITVPSICFSKIAVEIGPSYIINLSDYNWENTEGLNLGLKYQLSDKISIIPRLSIYKFSSEPIIAHNIHENFMGLSIANNETAFYDFSIGLRFELTQNIINPIFNLYSGVHYIKFGGNTALQFVPHDDSTYERNIYYEQQKSIGFVGAGFGILISLSDRINFITEGSFSVSFDYNFIFVPIDFSLQINF